MDENCRYYLKGPKVADKTGYYKFTVIPTQLMKNTFKAFLIFMLSLCLVSCIQNSDTGNHEEQTIETITENISESSNDPEDFRYEDVPAYDGMAYVEIRGSHPDTYNDSASEYISLRPLDELGRCQGVSAVLGIETLPEIKRGSIGNVKPTGWHTVRYDDLIESKYLYNRCHLVAYEISGINDDIENLVTGTRYMNIEGMLPWENLIAAYIKTTGNHVRYECTPVFVDDELVCRGVLMQASSVEDDNLEFCVFCYNVQPGIIIDYATGESQREEQVIERTIPSLSQQYVLNTNTKRFHYPDCDSVKAMKEKNKQIIESTREEIIEMGYTPCAVCNP